VLVKATSKNKGRKTKAGNNKKLRRQESRGIEGRELRESAKFKGVQLTANLKSSGLRGIDGAGEKRG